MRALAGLVATSVAAGIAGTALAVGAAEEAADEVVQACRHPNGGWVRIVSDASKCRAKEQAISWSVAGPAGPEGPPGPKGDPGAGLTKLGDLDGIACTTEDDAAGTVELDFAGDDTVLFRCVTGGTPPPPPPPEDGAKLVVNEIDYDQVGADSGGFVEIFNAGGGEADLTGIALVLVDGGTGGEYLRRTLTGTLAPGGYLVVEVDAQNGAPDGVALISAGGALLDALSYEGAIEAATIGGTTYDLVEGTVLPAATADSNTVTGSLARIPNGSDTDDAATDWAFTSTVTQGAVNVG